MGCVLGSLGFNLTVADIYETLVDEFPQFVIKALTDDLPVIIPKQETDADWYAVYIVYANFLTRWDTLANPLGLFRHKDKGNLFLPPDAPTPPLDSPLWELTKISRLGVTIGGAFIGTPKAVANAGIQKVDALGLRVVALLKLAKLNPHAAYRLTGTALNAALDYYLRCTPPDLISEAIANFDRLIEQATLTCLELTEHDTPQCCPTRMANYNARRCLSLGHGGAGHTTAKVKAPCAFIAATLATMDAEPLLENARINIGHRLAPSFALLASNLATTDLNFVTEVARTIPTSVALFIAPHNSSTPCEFRPDSNPLAMRMVQGILVKECSKVARLQVELSNNHDRGYIEGRSAHDINHNQLCVNRSQLSRIFQGSLYHYRNRLTQYGFAFQARYFFNLPALIPLCRDTGEQLGLTNEQRGFPVCAAGHPDTCTLDPTGNHATACDGGRKARYALHERINRTIIAFASEAGAQTRREPATADLLQNFCTADQIRTWFPKCSNPVTKQRAIVLRQLCDSYATLPRGEGRDNAMMNIHAFASATPGGSKGLRIDAQITFEDLEFWVDGGSVHPTSNSSLPAVSKWVKRLSIANMEAAGFAHNNMMLQEASPNVRAACAKKHGTYQGLIDIAMAQHKAGSRQLLPIFVAAIISHSGEMAPELITLIEHITMQFARSITARELEDGISKSRKTGEFRARFKDALMAAVSEGWGRALASAGQPFLPYLKKKECSLGHGGFFPGSDRWL